jgi:glycosyltransferase involved in cell wall biosynthesis
MSAWTFGSTDSEFPYRRRLFPKNSDRALTHVRILFLPRYGPQGASSRYRIWQYVPLFQRAGHDVEVQPLLEDGYLEELYTAGRRGWKWLAAGYVRRLLGTARMRRFDAIICEQEIWPFLPDFIEALAERLSRRFFVDYDDAAYANYARWPMFRTKISRVMAVAEAVVVGNSYLAAYARQFARRVSVIPTVVDLARYPRHRDRAADDAVRVAWIGTPVTARLLKPLMPVMERLQTQHPRLSFCFIGAGDGFLRNGLRAEIVQWSEQTETDQLSKCDIGIMPLPDDEFMRGKCGLKLIQYMASSLPVVASPVGVNREIVEEGTNGFLAVTGDEWFEKLDSLVRHPELRLRLGEAGRTKVESSYTLEHGFAKWQETLEESPIAAGAKHIASYTVDV